MKLNEFEYLQTADDFYLKKYGCLIPTLTNQPNGKSCNMNIE